MDYSKLLGIVRKGIEDFHLIKEGDSIAVGVSGGKDSLSLLYALAKIKKFYPKKFTIFAIMVDLGFENQESDKIEKLKEFCNSLDVPLHIVSTDIGKIVFDIREEKNPCALCAKLRRGALNKKAVELKCNKVALAHSMDDFIETFMLSLLYEGRLSTIQVKSYLTNSKLTVIRPLIYAKESQIIEISKNFPIVKNRCPADKRTKRQYAKELVKRLDAETMGGKERIRNAVLELVKEQVGKEWNKQLNNQNR